MATDEFEPGLVLNALTISVVFMITDEFEPGLVGKVVFVSTVAADVAFLGSLGVGLRGTVVAGLGGGGGVKLTGLSTGLLGLDGLVGSSTSSV